MDFRELLDTWDEFLLESEIETKINSMIDGQGFIMFFKKEEEFYGANEDGRVVFAKMKNPKNDDLPKGWDKEASFSAFNLNKMVKGEPAQHIFKKEDLKEIKIIEREEATEVLKKEAEKIGEKAFPKTNALQLIKLKLSGDDESPSFSRTDEE